MKKKSLKKYHEPRIIYEKEIETLATVCDSVWGDMGLQCRVGGLPCIHLIT